MAKKEKMANKANEYSLTDDMLMVTGQPVPQKKSKEQSVSQQPTPDTSWTHFTVICSSELVDKIKAIAQKEDFTIREVVEKLFKNGISSYESKHGPIKVKNRKRQNIDDVL